MQLAYCIITCKNKRFDKLLIIRLQQVTMCSLCMNIVKLGPITSYFLSTPKLVKQSCSRITNKTVSKLSFLYVCMVNTIYLLSFVETRGVSTKLNKYSVKIVSVFASSLLPAFFVGTILGFYFQ